METLNLLYICSVLPASCVLLELNRYWLSLAVFVSKWIYAFSKLMWVKIFHFIESNKCFKNLWISCTIDLDSWFFLVLKHPLTAHITDLFWETETRLSLLNAGNCKCPRGKRNGIRRPWSSSLHCHWNQALPAVVEAWLGRLKALPLHGQWRNIKPVDPFRKMW